MGWNAQAIEQSLISGLHEDGFDAKAAGERFVNEMLPLNGEQPVGGARGTGECRPQLLYAGVLSTLYNADGAHP